MESSCLGCYSSSSCFKAFQPCISAKLILVCQQNCEIHLEEWVVFGFNYCWSQRLFNLKWANDIFLLDIVSLQPCNCFGPLKIFVYPFNKVSISFFSSSYFVFFFEQVEDIVDTGHTLSRLIAHLKTKGAYSVSVCTFLDKPSRRKVSINLVGEGKFYWGFEVRVVYLICSAMSKKRLIKSCTSWRIISIIKLISWSHVIFKEGNLDYLIACQHICRIRSV